jgi:hypothetical protein
MPRSHIASSVSIGRLLLIAVLVIPVSACGGSLQVVDPTPQPQTPSHIDGYNVTIQATAVTGPAFCMSTPKVGTVGQEGYSVLWEGGAVSFLPSDPVDWDSFTGHLDGSQFTATNPPVGSRGCTHYLQASDLVGSFSADKNSFTAIEHWYFTLDSGEVKTVTFSWSGARR